VKAEENRRTCPACGTELCGAMKMCPVCMLRQALGGEVESGEPAPVSHRFEHYELVMRLLNNSDISTRK
jgi:hypothetical protein